MNNFKIILSATILNLKSYLRVKEAVFFSFLFPVFLFILFGFIWGTNYPLYINNLYIGVIAMTIASDALFSVGPIIRNYVTTNILKTLKSLPFNISFYFIGLAISRLISVFISIILISICAKIFFGYSVSIVLFINLLLGLILGSLMFSFLGLFFSFSFKPDSGKSIISMVYFFMLFLSGIFYPVSIMPKYLVIISNILPLRHLVLFLNGNWINFYFLIVWCIFFYFLFKYKYKNYLIKRD